VLLFLRVYKRSLEIESEKKLNFLLRLLITCEMVGFQYIVSYPITALFD
jgi:hypothetical protein